jgi:hypothetical protein
MRPAQRFLVAGIVVGVAEIALGIVLEGTAPYFWACAAVTAAFAFLARRLIEPPPPDGGDDPPQGDEEPPDPPWWPQFESQFRDHVLTRQAPRA